MHPNFKNYYTEGGNTYDGKNIEITSSFYLVRETQAVVLCNPTIPADGIFYM